MADDRPNLLDYGADPSMSHSSADALEAWKNDCNALKTTGVLPAGRFVCDRNIGPWIHAGLEGVPSGPNASDDAVPVSPTQGRNPRLGKNGSTIVIPAGPNQAQPWSTFATGTSIRNVRFLYIDQTAAGSGIDVSAYPVIEGAPPYYAPAITSEHNVNDDGTPRAAGSSRNGGRITIENVHFLGAYTGVYIRDDDADDQKGVSNVDINGLSGFCIKDMMVLGQISGRSMITDVSNTEGSWGEASSANDPLRRFILWRRQNGHNLWLTNRSVGLRVDRMGGRNLNANIRLSGGWRGDPEGPYRGLRSGRSNGLIVTRSGCESSRHFLLVDPDAYMHRCQFSVYGHCEDDADLSYDGAAVEILTDGDIAGNVNHDGLFRSASSVGHGWTAEFDFMLQESAGPMLRSGPKDPHGLYKISGRAASLRRNNHAGAAIVVEPGSFARIQASGFNLVGTRRGTQIAIDAPEPLVDHLHFDGCKISGFGELVKGKTPDPRTIMPGSEWIQGGVIVDPEDIDDDLDGEG